ncbi:hypothetical protein K523DRAFT_242553 [Schizophyllum commune Tattone D]|nr:hypothetical protein K523DRAFT_242553 [Schizophyllum commune Tattone D]
MRSFTAVAVAMLSLAGLAAAIRNPNNPADPINCPPSGGADKCSKETKCDNRIRFNYGSRQQGHYIWYLYNYDPNNLPQGIIITTDNVGTC